jgi:exfoliative toxin A/B
MRAVIRKVPVPLSGVMLSFAAFGNFIRNDSAVLWGVMEWIAGGLMALLVLKLILYPKEVARDLGNPAIAGTAGTFSMGMMFFAVSLKSLNAPLGTGFWWAGLLLHVALIIHFTVRFVFHFHLKQVYTTWFLVYVGIVAAAATGSAFGMQRLGQILVVYGLAATVVLMILMAARYRRIPAEKPLQPLGAICAAPFSLCLVGLNQSFPAKDPALVLTVFFLACIFYVLGLTVVLRFIGGTFYPSFSGFTFPFINTAIGTALTRNVLGAAGMSGTHMAIFSALAEIEIIIAGILLTIVFLRYAIFLFGAEDRVVWPEKRKEEEPVHYARAHSHTPQSDRL